jgi:heterodisulfide reductase subunit A2
MKTKQKHIAIIGGGPAGLEAADNLQTLGYDVTIFEKESTVGGKINKWYQLFPDRMPAQDVLKHLTNKLSSNVQIITGCMITEITTGNGKYKIVYNQGQSFDADAVLITVGYDLFDARIKEEYGYGIYDNVITSVDLEQRFRENKTVKTKHGKNPERIAFIHCVGSRDEKAGIEYCSNVCCVTGVKQAIEIKEQLPEAEVMMFYMDLRMHGRFYEDLYLEAQQKHHIQFIRGRLSEAAENIDGSVMLKADDTLAGCPIKVKADLVVLLIGFTPASCNSALSEMLNIKLGPDRFFTPCDSHIDTNSAQMSGIFVAGTCTGPKSLEYSLADARSAALKIHKYLVYAPSSEVLN